MTVDILFEDPRWQDIDLQRLAEVAKNATLRHLGYDAETFGCDLLACDDARIADLNAEFRGKPTPTNVLSWPAEDRAPATPGALPDLPDVGPDDPPEELGDIALALGVLTREAADAEKPFDHHLSHLLVHGLLHLLGFDHITDPDAARMEGLETRILARLGVPDPY